MNSIRGMCKMTVVAGLVVAAGLAVARPAGVEAATTGAGGAALQPEEGAFLQTQTGQRVAAFFEAINGGRASGYEAFTQEHRTAAAIGRATPDRRAEQFRDFVDQWGKLTIERLEDEGETVVVFARARNEDELVLFRFQIAAGEEGKIESLRIEPAASATLHNIENSQGWTQWGSLEQFLDQVRTDTGIPAIAVAVVKDGQLVESATVGVTRFGGDVAVGEDARFHWGSLTKALTATAIAMLVEDGVVTWDTTVAEALPDVECDAAFKAVTLRQLLSHTAGVQQYQRIDGAMGRRMASYPGGPVEQRLGFAEQLLNEPALFEPGAGFAYSNAGYCVAASMAEAMSGVAWEDLVGRVYEKLGMTHSGLGLPSGISEAEPAGHVGTGPEFRATEGGVPDLAAIWPAGNAHSDVEDLATFAAAHLAGLRGEDGVLKAETVAAMHEPAPGTAEAPGWIGYAMGWSVQEWPRAGVVSHAHNGSAGTYYATMRVFPEQDLVIVTLMNVGMPGDMLAPKVEAAVYGRFGE